MQEPGIAKDLKARGTTVSTARILTTGTSTRYKQTSGLKRHGDRKFKRYFTQVCEYKRIVKVFFRFELNIH